MSGTSDRLAREAENPYRQKLAARAAAWRARARIYFVQQRTAVGDGLIKIGVSANVQRRVGLLKSSSPLPLALLATMPGDDDIEHALHVRFKADRVKGEWFRPSPSLLAFIARLAKGHR